MPEQDAPRPRAQRPFRRDEVAGREGGSLGIDHPRRLHPVHQRDDHGDDPERGLEDRGQADRQQQRGEGHHQVGEAHQRSSGRGAGSPDGWTRLSTCTAAPVRSLRRSSSACTSRARASLSTTARRSLASGVPVKPSTSTGVDGPAAAQVGARGGPGRADQQRTGQSRALRERDRIDFRQRYVAFLQHLLQQRNRASHMVARGQLGHDTTILFMHGDLRVQRMRKQAALAVIQREAGFVAGGFDAEDDHQGK